MGSERLAVLALAVLIAGCQSPGSGVIEAATDEASESASEECPELVWWPDPTHTYLSIESAEQAASLPPYTRIAGRLSIVAPGLVDLYFLECLSEVADGIGIHGAADLESLAGLEAVRSVADPGESGSIVIDNNPSLRSLEGLSGVEVVPSALIIQDNPLLESTAGLSSLRTVEFVEIHHNDSLTTVELPGIEHIGRLTVGEGSCGSPPVALGSPALVHLDGLASLQTYDAAFLRGNPGLVSIEGLYNAYGLSAWVELNEALPFAQVEGLAAHLDGAPANSCGNLDEPTPCGECGPPDP